MDGAARDGYPGLARPGLGPPGRGPRRSRRDRSPRGDWGLRDTERESLAIGGALRLHSPNAGPGGRRQAKLLL